MRLDLADTSNVSPDLAESWTVSDDGKTFTFKLKPGVVFASGNPLTASDVAWSFERAVKLDKSPAFLLTQLGLSGDNVTETAKAADDHTFVLTVDQPYAPSFVLNVLSSTVGSVVDSVLVKEKAKAVTPSAEYKYDTDFGNDFLKTASAGSGSFTTKVWKANEAVVLERNDTYFGEKAKLARVIYRHIKESAGQRLALEAGDIDEALAAASGVGDDTIQQRSRGYVVPESFTHGTSAQRVRWFTQGYQSGQVQACDTFRARNL